VQISVDGGISWLPTGVGVDEKHAGVVMEAKCPGGSSGRSKKDGAEAWRRTICANLVKGDVSLPCGAKFTGHTDGVLSVPYRPFSQGPYKEKDLRVRKLTPSASS